MLLGLSPGQTAPAQDSVTVPKSRLEELERKEKELDRLKAEQEKAKNPKTQPARPDEKALANPIQAPPPQIQPSPVIQPVPVQSPPVVQSSVQSPPIKSAPVESPPVQPVVSYVSPPMDSLPALQPYDLVESMDLANYYHADVHWADTRFRKQKLSVRGEIVGFEKPFWNRTYRILLKTPTHEAKVICDLLSPEKANAVYTINHGEELVALEGSTQVPIAKTGQRVIVKGECKGLKDSVIMILAWDLKPAH
jgi:hypothetical protein